MKSIQQLYFKVPKISELLNEAVFVLDTSTIGELYSMNKKSLHVFLSILSYFYGEKRLFIPAQVAYEFQKNKHKFIENQKRQTKNPEAIDKFEFNRALNSHLKEVSDNPYFQTNYSEDELKNLELENKKIEESFNKIKQIVRTRIGIIQKDLDNNRNDIDSFFSKLKVGQPYDTQHVLEIMREGEFRYKHKFPPGYEDRAEQNPTKESSQIYGDLILWKQILDFGRQNQKSVIFICNDTKKDWYHYEGNKRVGPRHELIKEYFDTSGKEVWFFTLKDFVAELNRCLPEDVKSKFDDFDQLEILEKYLKDPVLDYVRIECKKCNKQFIVLLDNLYFDWDCQFTGTRYGESKIVSGLSQIDHRCNGVDVKFDICIDIVQSIDGKTQDIAIECLSNDFCVVEEEFNIENLICLDDYRSGYCQCCGEKAFFNHGMDYCDKCYDEYCYAMNED